MPNPQDEVAEKFRQLMRSAAQPVAVLSTCLDDAERTPHGATISSFASSALHPLPLVTFSIRKPSRLVDALHANRFANPYATHGVVNILAEHQPEISKMFSRPDLYPAPFLSIAYHREESMPILEDTVGALSCSVLTSLPMTTEVLQRFGLTFDEPTATPSSGLSSELFITRVTRVFLPRDSLNTPRKPLIYHQGGYTSIS